MNLLSGILLCSLISLVISADYDDFQFSGNAKAKSNPAPVPILKQINRHNDDGSYTYGYEGGDGSFKIETKLASGEVKGKYGYVDGSTGKVRVVEYGANKYGFQPSGEGITVAPPTLVDESKNQDDIDYQDERPINQHLSHPSRQQPQTRPRLNKYDDYGDSFARNQDVPDYQDGGRPSQHLIHHPSRQQTHGEQSREHNFFPANIHEQQKPVTFKQPDVRKTDVYYSPEPRPKLHFTQDSFNGDKPHFIPAPQNYPTAGNIQAEPVQYMQRLGQTPPQRPQTSYRPPPPIPQQQADRRSAGSLLDQLAKDYALPQSNTQPLHDISFGYY